ncbi:DUF4442 domain-containing protein [Tenacibaculum caenipelagi]|uniref:Acyl-coenzyme A thioesterase PaaI-like protein n=1 Tax=Tenacibaculum caenipelagi TaxID=1325435 RepID=A0A4R6TDH7_9FLAO|nr:DUF4442 domain-containing protein [Tenacibaculum caenipelagi]TDQ23817.1 acyl-coenzyme A thioesterase PaaI-like protein [Tenacibaculum caenipelagi]
MYATISNFLKKFFKQNTIFKYGFNISPMYRRSTGKINYVSEDLLKAQVKIPITYRNKNYVGSIFGGSLFSATDPVFMIQLINILGNEYVVWDKEASIKFKRPAKQDAYADFMFSEDEIKQIQEQVKDEQEINLIKEIKITNKDESVVFAEVSKTIYIADKIYYKNKRKKK